MRGVAQKVKTGINPKEREKKGVNYTYQKIKKMRSNGRAKDK